MNVRVSASEVFLFLPRGVGYTIIQRALPLVALGVRSVSFHGDDNRESRISVEFCASREFCCGPAGAARHRAMNGSDGQTAEPPWLLLGLPSYFPYTYGYYLPHQTLTTLSKNTRNNTKPIKNTRKNHPSRDIFSHLYIHLFIFLYMLGNGHSKVPLFLILCKGIYRSSYRCFYTWMAGEFKASEGCHCT